MLWPLNSPLRKRPSVFAQVALLLFTLFTVINFLIHVHVQIPPPLSPLLSHTLPKYPPSVNDWKRPLTISLHARLNQSSVRLTLFTTGVHTDTYGRAFSVVGCMIGDLIVPVVETHPEMTVCHVHRSSLVHDVPLTVVLHYDQSLQEAINQTQHIKGEQFTVYPHDIRVLPEGAASHSDMPSKLASVRTAVRWRHHMMDVPNKSRYQLCAMTAMRQYPFLLSDWMRYYRRMGVDYFYIYENNADAPLRQNVNLNFGEVVHWPWSRSQMQSNNHFLLAAPNRCRFVVFFDADEYVMVGDSQPKALKRYILSRRKEGYLQVVFHFLMMVNSGYVKRPKGSLPELYTLREKGQQIKQGKVAIDTDFPWTWHRIHLVDGRGGRTYWNTTLELNPQSLQHNSMLVHYSKRSWEDFVAKNAVGGASVMTTGRPKKALDVDKPDEKYMAIQGEPFDGFSKQWKRVMERADERCVQLEMRNENGQTCSQRYCPRSLLNRFRAMKCNFS
eukprot:TRINITY_DN478_c0_g1_i1.p1 TRINITY_DN478_c0_g1~~TRINITY_DN478_c0_g1_i1.p1  ORF type:complete len:500 (-),score=55.84 TRINITY_DN478_c0_g1_i1:4286-5785(-)